MEDENGQNKENKQEDHQRYGLLSEKMLERKHAGNPLPGGAVRPSSRGKSDDDAGVSGHYRPERAAVSGLDAAPCGGLVRHPRTG